MKVIECNGLTKAYGKCMAVNDISFEIEENSITGLIGRNGAGKTTLLKLISGYYKSSGGAIKVFGQNPFNSLAVSAQTIFIDDNMSFPKSLSLDEVMKVAKGFYPVLDEVFCRRLMSYFNLDPNKQHSQLSKGMKSTFNVIIGITSRCPLTIMDEPTTGMDAAVRKDFYKILLKDYIENPRTIVLSSHLLNELEDILEDILLLNNGSKCLHMPLVDLKEYAVGYHGKVEIVDGLSKGKKILFQEDVGKDYRYAVIEVQNYEDAVRNGKESGVEVKPVSASDLCIYLTSSREGGIDDVFRNE